MRILLKKDIFGLGKAGEIVNVKDGYGNYLIRTGSAELCTDALLRKIENEKKLKNSIESVKKKKALELKTLIENIGELVFEKSSSKEGKIFGSVSSIEVMEELKKKGITVEKGMILMDHIKEVGIHPVKIKLFPGIEATLKIRVIPKEIGTR
ncbi:MAG: 50S ribosomal protein L9 [candidate division WOR-3 bacterium]